MMNSIQNNITQKPKPSKKRKLLFLGLGLALAGAVSFFGLKYWNSKKAELPIEPEVKPTKPATKTKIASKPSKPKSNVATKPVQPKQEQASKSQGSKPKAPVSKPIDAPAIARSIHAAVLKKDFAKAFDLLKNIKNTKDYSAVSKVFTQMFVGGVRQTLVNGLLNTFKDEKQKQSFRKAFTAMGLKYDGKKWSLSGIGESLLITTAPTKVWKDPKHSVSVPVNMVLGKEVARRGGHTVFENNKQFFLVDTKTIKAYQP